MPINAYTGLMGSGKSYECVSSVIIPAIKSGRRVVTNVDGIDSDAIRAYCQEKFDSDIDKLGHVVHCKNEDVHKHDFLPCGDDVDAFCKPGDIICIDEAWRFWGTDCKLLPQHRIFFREHRHFVDPHTKVSCDLVLMVQDISDLHRVLKVVVEVSFRTTKIKTLGWDKTYRVEMWEGYKQTARGRVAVENKRYSKEIFPLYSSYQGGAGKELRVDDRQNILKNPKIWIIAVLTVVIFCVSIYSALSFFNGSKFKDKNKPPAADAANMQRVSTGNLSARAGTGSSQPPIVSDTWRLLGTYQVGNSTFVALANDAGRIRLEHPSAFQNFGLTMVGDVDDQRVLAWTGPAATHPTMGGQK